MLHIINVNKKHRKNATILRLFCLFLQNCPVQHVVGFPTFRITYLKAQYPRLLTFEKEIVKAPGGAFECQGGYRGCIRVVFQDQALYARTSFRGAKTCKIGKKGVFLVI